MRQQTSDTFDAIERQLAEERAAALTRIAGRLDALLRALEALAQQCRSLSGPAQARAIDAYRERHAEARRYRWYLEVQRECLGLSNHDVLDEVFPQPRRLELPFSQG